MDVTGCVLSAGRAVLDVLEREWQLLSSGELELRLDQEVEEVLESQLRAELEAQQPPVYLQMVRAPAQVRVQGLQPATSTVNLPEREEKEEDHGDSSAVKYISDLLQSSKSRARMTGRARLSPSQTVLLSLSLLSERVSYRTVSQRFQLEKGNIHRIFFSFCEHINMLEEKLIRWPVGSEAVEVLFPFSVLLGKGKPDRVQGIPQVLGVLGHTRIPIRLPIGKCDMERSAPEVKRVRKEVCPDTWLNLELVCDCRGRFLHCRLSKGSDVDWGSTLRDKFKQHPELMPSDCFLVAKAGYPLSAHILTPYTGSGSPREEFFNQTLEKHFHILDQAVTNLRARFQRLRCLDIGNYERARAVVLTACVLHNAFLDVGDMIEREAEKEGGINQVEQGEVDEEGKRKRNAIADLLFKNSGSGRT
ncbi:uncharacterized protein KZ484_003099 [Pholidichthys leucotaenia]